MPEPDEPYRHPLRILGKLILWSLLGMFLYVLSFGPAYWLLFARSDFIDRALNAAYRPIWLNLYEVKALRPLELYFEWGMALPGSGNQRFTERYTRSLPAP